jgi:CheY-like chemotaxis protein
MARTVAVLNSNEDVVEMLRSLLEGAGFNTVTGRVPELKRGEEDLIAFLKTHNPDVIIYDIAPPYHENWNFLKLVLDTDVAKGRKFVLTTANERLLREAAGKDIEVFEIAEKPDNLNAILTAVRRP